MVAHACTLVCCAAVLLNSYKRTPDSEKLSYDLHFWIGEESTQDEYGVAAYKTVELDDLLTGTTGSSPVQHRQVMGHESELFLSYFPNGLIIEAGGIDLGKTGFTGRSGWFIDATAVRALATSVAANAAP